MNYVMKNVKTGEMVMVESLEKAYEMLESHDYLFGFLTFIDKEQFDASIQGAAK